MRTLGTITVAMLGILVGACGNSGSNGGGNSTDAALSATYVAGIDGSLTLSTLTDTQKTDLCSSGISYYSMSITRDEACLLRSVMNTAAPTYVGTVDDTLLQIVCSREVSDCLKSTPGSRSFYTTLCIPKLSCAGKVAEYETCVNDLGKALVRGMVGFPECHDLTATNYKSVKDPSTSLADTNKPASCRALDIECSGLTQAIMTLLWPGGR